MDASTDKTLFIITEEIKKIRDDQQNFNLKLDTMYNKLFVSNGENAIVVEIKQIKDRLHIAEKNYENCPAKKRTIFQDIIKIGAISSAIIVITQMINYLVKGIDK